ALIGRVASILVSCPRATTLGTPVFGWPAVPVRGGQQCSTSKRPKITSFPDSRRSTTGLPAIA
ncbi:hypothetical protein IscW_ISCW001959, partial [Ixodes scapularis]